MLSVPARQKAKSCTFRKSLFSFLEKHKNMVQSELWVNMHARQQDTTSSWKRAFEKSFRALQSECCTYFSVFYKSKSNVTCVARCCSCHTLVHVRRLWQIALRGFLWVSHPSPFHSTTRCTSSPPLLASLPLSFFTQQTTSERCSASYI